MELVLKAVTTSGAERYLKSTETQQLIVRAITETEIENASGSGDAYCWASADSDIDAGDTRLFIKNTGDRFLILSRAIFSPANVACKYNIGIGSETTTPTGTTVTAVNMNENFSSKVPDYVAYDDETAVADATKMFAVMTNTTNSIDIPLDGIILGKNQYIQINQETESTSGQVAVFGFFANEVG